MFLAICAILLSCLAYATCNIIDAYVCNNVIKKPKVLIFYGAITNLMAIPLLFLFGTPGPLPVEPVFLCVLFLIVAIEIGYQIPYLKALKMVDTSIVVAMFSLAKVMIPVMAYLMLGEKLHLTQYIGFFIVIFINIILSLEKDIKKKLKFSINMGFYLMLFVSIILSFASILTKKALLSVDWVTYIFWMTLLSTLLSFCLYFIPSYRKDIKKEYRAYIKNIKTFLLLELCAQIGKFSAVFALSLLPVLVYSGVEESQPIFVLLLGVILNKFTKKQAKEKTNLRDFIIKLSAFILIILGITLTII